MLKKPKAVLIGKTSQLAYRNIPLKPVQIKMIFFENTAQGEGSFFNNSLIVSDFIWSKEKTSFKLKAHQLNFIPLLPSTTPSSLFSSQVTGSAVLYLPQLKISKASGNFNIQDISLSHGKRKISSTHPISIQLKNGTFSFQSSLLKLKNNDQFLTLKKINSQESLLSGPIHLEILTLFVPYITSAKGILDMHFSLKNNLAQLSPKGSISIQEGSFEGGPFLDTFQNINLNGELTPQQLNIKKWTAQTSTGSLEGSGSINYSKKHKLPLDLSVQFNQLALNLSKNVKVQGSGIAEFYGDQKPYILKGHFYLNEGWSKGEFENTEKIQMPKINQKQTPWFNINLWVHLKNPFLIENDLILASVEGSLHLLGSHSMPIVSGTLDFLPGGLFYIKDYDFKITSGQAVYEKKPFFNPYLDLTGQTQFEETQYIEDREVNNNYEITAHVHGPVESIDLKLSSNPPISENNILSMMALGARSVEFGGSSQLSNVARYSYSQIASALFQGTIGRRLENLLGVELSIIPYISQNKATTKVRARKRWSENLSTSATTSIDEIDRSLRVEYNLTPNFSLLGIWKESKDITIQEEYNFEIEYRVDF